MITPLPDAPLPTDTPDAFNTKAFTMLAALDGFVTEFNNVVPDIEGAIPASQAAVSSANYKGEWSTLSGALSIPASVSYGGGVWLLITNTSNVVSDVPGVSAKWLLVSKFNNPVFTGIREKVTVAATAATGTVNFDYLTQAVLLFTANASAHWTLNVRGNSGATLNSVMDVGDTLSITHMVTMGTTGYYNNVFKIDGITVTPKWLNGVAPTYGNPSSIDAYSYAIIKTANATFSVIASQARYA